MPPPSLQTVNRAIGAELGRASFSYSERDAILYALGVGAPADPLDPTQLRSVYELSGDFQVLPTFAVIFARDLVDDFLSGDIAGIKYNPMMMVHGEHQLDLLQPLPRAATVHSTFTIADIHDKGSGLLLVVDVNSCDQDGTPLALAQTSVFIRGCGGFGGERGEGRRMGMPERAPDHVYEERTMTRQALLYRLAGDANPLHADPQMAAVGGFDKPILHGLCTYGFAARAILKAFCANDARRLRGIDARFSHHVFPGETLITEMWRVDTSEVRYRTKVQERDVVVLSHGCARLRD